MRVELLDRYAHAGQIVDVLRAADLDLYGTISPARVTELGNYWWGVFDEHTARLVACVWVATGNETASVCYLAATQPGAGLYLLRRVCLAILPAMGIRNIKGTVDASNVRWQRVLARMGAVIDTRPLLAVTARVGLPAPVRDDPPILATTPPASACGPHKGSQGPCKRCTCRDTAVHPGIAPTYYCGTATEPGFFPKGS